MTVYAGLPVSNSELEVWNLSWMAMLDSWPLTTSPSLVSPLVDLSCLQEASEGSFTMAQGQDIAG